MLTIKRDLCSSCLVSAVVVGSTTFEAGVGPEALAVSDREAASVAGQLARDGSGQIRPYRRVARV
jgi:hypothetical protein